MEFSKKLHNCIFNDFKGLNLTNISEFSDFHKLQIQDSLAPITHSKSFLKNVNKYKTVIDIGFGGGFPLLPLANELKEVKFLGIDARLKKVKAVGEISKKLELENVKVMHERIENMLFDKSAVITVKAVGDIDKILAKINFSSEIVIYFYKGPKLEEKEDMQIDSRKWRLLEDVSYDLDDVQRRIISFKGKNVPCGTFGKNLLKISKYI